MLQDIMNRYSFEYLVDKFFEITQETEEKWTVERKFVLFRRWGSNFIGVQLHRLIPTRPTSIVTSVLSFLNEVMTRTIWLIVNDSLKLIYIVGIDFEPIFYKKRKRIICFYRGQLLPALPQDDYDDSGGRDD